MSEQNKNERLIVDLIGYLMDGLVYLPRIAFRLAKELVS